MINHWPIAIVLAPLFGSFFVAILGYHRRYLAYPIAVVSCFFATLSALITAFFVQDTGSIRYMLGGWPPPLGIEYRVDTLNALVVVMVALVGLLTVIFSKYPVQKELGNRIASFYTLFLLFFTGVLGMTITGDAFNLYVLIEIASLSGYALLAFGQKRAYLSAFNYVIMGSIGASFYLLGVGYLFLKTGTLNMVDLSHLISYFSGSQAIWVGFILILTGLFIKMAFFPVHGWLPNAYERAPIAVSCLIAPLMTKVSVYVMLRFNYYIFGPRYVFESLSFQPFIVALSVVAIVAGALLALTQKRLKRMLTFVIVSEIGYMVGGAFLGNAWGFKGATYHLLTDGLMTACFFMVSGCIVYVSGRDTFSSLKGFLLKMPFTGLGFVIAGLSLIGIPPTPGFFSKWYLLSGAYHAGAWAFMIALLFSSIVNAILFFRVLEIGFFNCLPSQNPQPIAVISRKEAPWSMVAPLLVTAALLVVLGLGSQPLVTFFIEPSMPKGF